MLRSSHRVHQKPAHPALPIQAVLSLPQTWMVSSLPLHILSQVVVRPCVFVIHLFNRSSLHLNAMFFLRSSVILHR